VTRVPLPGRGSPAIPPRRPGDFEPPLEFIERLRTLEGGPNEQATARAQELLMFLAAVGIPNDRIELWQDVGVGVCVQPGSGLEIWKVFKNDGRIFSGMGKAILCRESCCYDPDSPPLEYKDHEVTCARRAPEPFPEGFQWERAEDGRVLCKPIPLVRKALNLTMEQRATLLAAGPNLYGASPEAGRETPFSVYGFEAPPGWYEILLELTRQLEAEILTLPEGKRALYKASQVKSKFGGLRFYMNAESDEMGTLIADAEIKSLTTCETCGAPAQRHLSGTWMYTACDEHVRPDTI
jgi:hypothetical protein